MKKIIEIPEGTSNIVGLFPVYMYDVTQYYIEAVDTDGDVIGTTRILMPKPGCSTRLHFINSLGKLEGMNFKSVEIIHQTKGDDWERANPELNPSVGGVYRRNIKANDVYEVESTAYPEKELYWLEELVNSPYVWIEKDETNGLNTTTEKRYVSIYVHDSKILKKALYGSYLYKLNISFSLSNSRRNLR